MICVSKAVHGQFDLRMQEKRPSATTIHIHMCKISPCAPQTPASCCHGIVSCSCTDKKENYQEIHFSAFVSMFFFFFFFFFFFLWGKAAQANLNVCRRGQAKNENHWWNPAKSNSPERWLHGEFDTCCSDRIDRLHITPQSLFSGLPNLNVHIEFDPWMVRKDVLTCRMMSLHNWSIRSWPQAWLPVQILLCFISFRSKFLQLTSVLFFSLSFFFFEGYAKN